MTKLSECEYKDTVSVNFMDHVIIACKECKAYKTVHGEGGELEMSWQPIEDIVDDLEKVFKTFKKLLND